MEAVSRIQQFALECTLMYIWNVHQAFQSVPHFPLFYFKIKRYTNPSENRTLRSEIFNSHLNLNKEGAQKGFKNKFPINKVTLIMEQFYFVSFEYIICNLILDLQQSGSFHFKRHSHLGKHIKLCLFAKLPTVFPYKKQMGLNSSLKRLDISSFHRNTPMKCFCLQTFLKIVTCQTRHKK